jgi:hypothetical protein
MTQDDYESPELAENDSDDEQHQDSDDGDGDYTIRSHST